MQKRLIDIRWNWVVAATCLGLLAWFRASDGRLAPAALLAAAATGAAVLAVRSHRPGVREPVETRTRKEGQRPDAGQIERTLTWHRAHSRAWLATVLFCWATAMLGVVVFAPLALVGAAAAVYALARYRRARTYVRTLTAVLHQMRGGVPHDGHPAGESLVTNT